MSDYTGSLEDILKKITAIEDLCKGARDEINDFLKKSDRTKESRINFTEKLVNCVNCLHNEANETKNLANLSCQKVTDANEDETEGNKENETENAKEWKPRLKIVDFSKLVDPRNLELMDKNQKKKKQDKSSSIIILSSSDDEISNINKPVNKTISITTKTQGKRKKTSIIVKDTSSKEKSTEITSKSTETEKNMKKLIVKVLRVPCEEMKDFYSKKSTNNVRSRRKTSEPILDEKTGLIMNCSSSSSDDSPLTKYSQRKKNDNSEKTTELAINEDNSKETPKQSDKLKEKTDDSDATSDEVIVKKKRGLKLSLSMRKSKARISNDDSSDEEIENMTRKTRNNKNKSKLSSDIGSEAKKMNTARKVKKVSFQCQDLSDNDTDNDKGKNTKEEVDGSSSEDFLKEKTDKTNKKVNKINSGVHDKLLKNDKSCSEGLGKDIEGVDNEHTKESRKNGEKADDSVDEDESNLMRRNDEDKEESGKNTENGKRPESSEKNPVNSQQNSEEDMFGDTEVTENPKVASSPNIADVSLVTSSDSERESSSAKKVDGSSDSDSEKKRRKKDSSVDSNDDSDDFATFCRKKAANQKSKKVVTDSEEDSEEKKSDCDKGKESAEGEDSHHSSADEKNDKKSGKKRRIQKNDDSSDSDSKSTRKKIKKVISRSSLSDSTKKAAAEERERKQRILEKQQKYNQIYENLELANSKVEKLILDVDEKTEKPIVEVAKSLVSKLKPHQASGVQFMWDACFESLERAKTSEGSGCILAHCMGLGKTLQVITLTNTLLENRKKTNVKKVLIVCPLSTVINWKNEFSNWLSGEEDYDVFEMASCKPINSERATYIKNWHLGGGVMIMSYAMFRNLSNNNNKRVSKKFRDIFTQGLVDPGPDIVICDEGHLLKNEKTSLSISMNKIKTRRRIVLTGTPLQNNLKEYYCMVQFVKPNLLGTYKEYLNRFVNPISNGQYTDSTQYDIDIMRRRSHVLHKLLDGIVQRRDYSVLSPYLPPKHEYVLFLTLSEVQRKLYEHYMKHFARKSDGTNRTSFLFQDFQNFSRICIHPRVLLDKSTEDQLKYKSDDEEDSSGSLKDFIDDNDTSSSSSSSESSSESDRSESSKKKKKKKGRRVTRAQKAANPNTEESEEEEIQPEKEWWQEYCDGEELDNISHSTKLLMLFEILKECEQIGDKVLVFSQSLYALNVIEYFLGKVDEATQNGDAEEKTCGYTGSWALGLDYFRLDGSTNCALRAQWCDSFNKESNSRARLFLLSTRAGGLGINLVAANRVIIFDVSWNPSSDVQSIYRVYRFGQLKPSYIYRFVIYGTMEMKIYERQVTKQAISKRVIDEQQIDRHYNQHDLAELYKFDVPGLDDRPIPMVPKDVLLGELLQNQDKIIFKYHEHQSLLENKEDETLNEEERKAAWDEFENEKVQRNKQGTFIGKFSISTIQLALRSIIQRDNPSWNMNQILSIIPQLTQQLNAQIIQGDFTMYNRIAVEIKRMQEDYARRIQVQYQQQRLNLEAQRLLASQNQLPNLSTPQMNMFQQLFSNVNSNAGPSRLNSNNVIELN